MPILHYANRLDHLIPPLVQHLRDRDPFEPISVVVPNFSLQKWISLRVAEQLGIAANLRFVPLEKAIVRVLHDEGGVPSRTQLLQAHQLQQLLLDALAEAEAHPDEVWQPLRDYISGNGALSARAHTRRRFQLAERLAKLLQEYEYSRSELLVAWRKGNRALPVEIPGDPESWQKALWERVLGPNGMLAQRNQRLDRADRREPRWKTLPELCEAWQPKPCKHDEALHIFGLSYFSGFHQNLLAKQLEAVREIHVYTLNPCREFWEDLQTVWEQKAGFRKGLDEGWADRLNKTRLHFERDLRIEEQDFEVGELFEHEEENPLLQAWGRPGRENIRLLNQITEWQFEEHFQEAAPDANPTVLQQVQQDILNREPRRLDASSLGMPQDASLEILACPNPSREAEIVANTIWDTVRHTPGLRFHEIAVIVPDMATYQHELEQAFEALHDLPYNLIDGTSSSASRLAEVAEGLLQLGDSNYSRRDCFALFDNPCFCRHFVSAQTGPQGEPLDLSQWRQWVDDLGIFYGIDTEHNRERGYPHLHEDRFSWEQGFRRLELGRLLTPGLSADPDGVCTIQKERILPHHVPQEQAEAAARFLLIVRSLFADTRDLPSWQLSGAQWSDYLRLLFQTYLAPATDADESEFQTLLQSVQKLRDLDWDDPPGTIAFPTVLEFFRQQQTQATVHRGHYLAEGVTLSSFLPMRPIPFKAVFILGLGEGKFPSPPQQDNLDLRTAKIPLAHPIRKRLYRERRLGDVSPPERDRYMFLETFVSTQERLVLSYVSRNEITGETLQPSSVIQTLKEVLNDGYLAQAFQETAHPLKAYAPEYFPAFEDSQPTEATEPLPNYDPQAFQQARALWTRKQLGREHPGQPISKEILEQTAVGRALQPQWPPAEAPEIPESLTLTLSQLRAFLECPLQASAKRMLGLFEEDGEDRSNLAFEPSELDRLTTWQLLDPVWDAALREGPEVLEAVLKQQVERFDLEGRMPAEVLKSVLQEQHLKDLRNCWRSLETPDSGSGRWVRFLFGPVREGGLPPGYDTFASTGPYRLCPPVRLQVELPEKEGAPSLEVELHGHTEWWWCEEGTEGERQKTEGIVVHPSTSSGRTGPETSESPIPPLAAVGQPVYRVNSDVKDKHWLRPFLEAVLLQASGAAQLPDFTQAQILSPKKSAKALLEIPDSEAAKTYLATLVRAMLCDPFDRLFPIETVQKVHKQCGDAISFNAEFPETLQEDLDKDPPTLSSCYGPIRFLEDYGPPDDPWQWTEQRLGLFFRCLPQ